MRKHVIPALAAVVVLSGLATPGSAGAVEPPARRPSLREQVERHRSTGRVQVRFKDGVGAARRDAALGAVRARGLSVRVDRRIAGLNAAVLSVSDPRAAQALLRSHPDVSYVEAESRYRAFQAEPVSPELTEIGAAAAHAGEPANTGAGQTIAILDSPVDGTNPDLDSGKVVFSGNYTADVPADPEDPFQTQDFECTAATCPHGTAVAAAAAAQAGDGNMSGVAPDASIRSYNVFRRFVYTFDNMTFEQVGASSFDIAAALTAVKNHAVSDPSIVAVNMSLGGPFDNQLIKDAIKELHDAAPRVSIVVAAGNDGGERANFPAGDPYVLSVGATGQVTGGDCSVTPDPSTPWTLAFFSNRGDVDVVAPGHCVNVWYPAMNEDTGAVLPGTAAVRKESGTSFAAPMVAGVAALLAASPTPLTGDAARAAIIAGAEHPVTANVGAGSGAVEATSALALGAGTAPFTSVSLDRGGHVAHTVGKRGYEVIRVEPGAAATTTAPVPTVTSGFGSLTAGTVAATTGLARRYGTFSAAVKSGSFTMTAAGGAGGADTAVAPLKMLDSANNYEGLPAATGDSVSVALTYGTRSAYIRSAAVNDGAELKYGFRFDPHGWDAGADLFLWEPIADGKAADAAMEPIAGHWGMEDPETMRGSSSVIPGFDTCYGMPCNRGRWLVGWVTFSSADSSAGGSTYGLSFSYPGPTATVAPPGIASSASVSGPFTVSWGGTRATKWNVSYAVKTKSGSTYSITAWKPWKTGTTAKSAVFGSSGSPETIVAGRTYHFRVQAYDSLGNPSRATTKYTVTPYDDRSGSMRYGSGWTRVATSTRWLRTATKTSTAGARVSLTVDASAFTIVGDKCTTCGQFKVYLDGVYKKTVDTYWSGGTAVRRQLWSSGALSGGIKSRRVTIIAVGTRNRPKVVLDGIAATR